MSPITTHILDTSIGRPAADVNVELFIRSADGEFHLLGSGTTNSDGRIADLLPAGKADAGTYRLVFQTGDYFKANDTQGFYPEVSIDFLLTEPEQHYHVPLLLNPFGYSTYRGS